MNIFLIGYRCSGKTRVGSRLAQSLNLKFVDTDEEIVLWENQSIQEIVEKNGWDYFRKKEEEILEKIIQHKNQVVATGGGIILSLKNQENLKKNGKIIWLKTSATETIKRMQRANKINRPALTNKNLTEEIIKTLEEREPIYQSLANLTLETDNLTYQKLVNKIVNNL